MFYKTKSLESFAESKTFYAERTRFELVVRYNPYVGLANRWFQPLTHLSMTSYTNHAARDGRAKLQHFILFPIVFPNKL